MRMIGTVGLGGTLGMVIAFGVVGLGRGSKWRCGRTVWLGCWKGIKVGKG